MSSDPTITPPPVDAPKDVPTLELPPHVKFSGRRWFFTGLGRLSYRAWTRIAARLFPEDSKSERLAQALHIPLPDKLNMSWVTEHLGDDAEAMAQEQIELLHLPTPDTYPLTLEQLWQGASWVHERIEKGGHCLVHCEHGVGRSVLLTCAVLVYSGMHAQDALQLVREKRWQASPNHRQVVRLREFEAVCAARRKA